MLLTEEIRNRLGEITGTNNVFLGDAIGERYRTDITGRYSSAPALLIRTSSTDEVSEILKVASEHGLPVTVIGGQTGTVGGAVPSDGGIALSLERMNRIEEIDIVALTMTVEAGCTSGDW